MKGLSAKVFRTYNASVTLEKELPDSEELEGMTVAEKVIRYNDANPWGGNCNRKKTVSNAQLATTFNNKLEGLKKQKNDLQEWLKLVEKKEKIPTKEDDSALVNKLKEDVTKAVSLKESATSDEEKLRAVETLDRAKAAQKADQERKFNAAHMFAQQAGADSIRNRIATWETKVTKLETDIKTRDDNKEVALGTSKINYMDPRITVV